MADVFKVLAQSAPAATTLTDVYTTPSSTNTTISSITIANQSATDTTFRLSVAVAGAADSTEQYLYYDVALPGNDTLIATVGITLDQTDVLRAYVNDATVSINVFGVEVT